MNVAELRALAERATPAPWAQVGPPWGDGTWVTTGDGDPHAGDVVCDCRPDRWADNNATHDAALIAAMRNALPALLDRIEAQQHEINIRGEWLRLSGFVRCDIPACNCGSWHHRYGLPERFKEIKAALDDADHPVCNDNGNNVLNALRELIADRDEARSRIEALERVAVEAKILEGWVRSQIEIKDDGPYSQWDYDAMHMIAPLYAALAALEETKK